MNNLKNMSTRLDNRGGPVQQDRMIKDKQQTLERAVQYSYQGAQVQLVNSKEIVSALMNPNKLLADYDEKTISVNYGCGFKTGEVFRWINPLKNNEDTYWLIYLQDLTELAYFRANARRCNYTISQFDDQGNKYTLYVCVKGPKEKNIQTIYKSNYMLDLPNYTLSILMPNNEISLKFFQRYTKFYLSDINHTYNSTCWRVEAIDSISTPGILEIYAKEYQGNNDQDDMETGKVGGLIEPIITKEQIEDENKSIVGDAFIKPKFEYTFKYVGSEQSTWSYDSSLPIQAEIMHNCIKIKWNALYSGQFILQYGSSVKTIIVESLV